MSEQTWGQSVAAPEGGNALPQVCERIVDLRLPILTLRAGHNMKR